MPKAIEGVATSGVFQLPYRSPDEMPWEDIEHRVGVQFTDDDRREIFQCYVHYHVQFSVEASRVPLVSVFELKRSIVGAAQLLLEVCNRFRNSQGPSPSDQDEDLFLAVALSSKQKGFDLSTSLRKIAPMCKELIDGLGDNAVGDGTSRLMPETIALAHFVAKVVKDAKPKPARSNRGYVKSRSAREYDRWGMALGPKASKMATFATAVLDIDVTPSQVEHAFRCAKDLNLIP